MVERVQNVIKSDAKKGIKRPTDTSECGEPKRKKGDSAILRRYPIGSVGTSQSEDNATLEQHKKAITTELAKSKPRDTVLLPLLKLTYDERRMYILKGGNTIKEVLEEYPALSKPAIVRWLLLTIWHF